MYDIIIIGGGAAGLFAASAAGKLSGGKSLRGLILEGGSEPGQKLLLTGAGQCNLTHAGSIKEFPAHYGKNGGKIRSALYGFSNDALCRFLEEQGLETVCREDGKIYPVSFSARQVRDHLVTRAKRNGFEILTGQRVTGIYPGDEYQIVTEKNRFTAKTVLICTGGCSFPATGSDGSLFAVLENLGFTTIPRRPALVPVSVEGYPYGSLSGASVKSVRIVTETGEVSEGDLLFTHRAFSGPAALHISRYVRPGSRIRINYVPEMDWDEVERSFAALRMTKVSSGKAKDKGRKEIFTVLRERFTAQLPEALLRIFFESEGVDLHRRFAESRADDIEKILNRIFRDTFTVSGTAGFSAAMVTAGGVELKEVYPKTMESRQFPGLYLAGEVLDVDGDTGGYNLQFAFSSAWAAMKDICEKHR